MLTHFCISQQGKRHIDNNIPCQDSSHTCRLHIDRFDKTVIIAAIADGVGSCMFSEEGATTAVEGFVECVSHNLVQGKNIHEYNDESIERILRCAFNYALAKVFHTAEDKSLPFIEFDSTLTGVIYDGETLWFGHVGDDGVVALYTDGEYEMITSRHKGEEVSSVYPLRAKDYWQFGKTAKSVASAVLMTDGVLDHCVASERFNNRVYYPFLEPALTEVMADDEVAKATMEDWAEYLGGSEKYPVNFRALVTDDITFAVIQNSQAVENLPEITFDSIQWNQDTQKYIDELNRLSSENQEENNPAPSYATNEDEELTDSTDSENPVVDPQAIEQEEADESPTENEDKVEATLTEHSQENTDDSKKKQNLTTV